MTLTDWEKWSPSFRDSVLTSSMVFDVKPGNRHGVVMYKDD